MVDVAKRGAELVLTDQFCLMAAEAGKIADILKDRPDEFGLSRIAAFIDGFNDIVNETNEIAVAYMAAERIRGRK
jgi:hypothetical protein